MSFRDDLQQAAPAGRESDRDEHCSPQTEPHREQPIQVRLERPLRQREKSQHVFSRREDGREAVYVTVIPPLTLAHGLEAVVDRIDLCGERVASMAYGRSSRRHFEVAGSETHLVDPARPHWNRANVRVEPAQEDHREDKQRRHNGRDCVGKAGGERRVLHAIDATQRRRTKKTTAADTRSRGTNKRSNSRATRPRTRLPGRRAGTRRASVRGRAAGR